MKEAIELIQPILVVLNTFLIVVGLLYTIRHYRFNRTWSYIERYNSSDFIETRKFVRLFTDKIESIENDKERVGYIRTLLKSKDEKDIEMNIHISRYINLFTELGVTYRSGAWSKKAIVSISSLVVSSWEKLEPYIREVQELRKPQEVHNSFEMLYKFIRKKGLEKIK